MVTLSVATEVIKEAFVAQIVFTLCIIAENEQ